MDNKKKLALGVGALVIFIIILDYLQKEKERKEKEEAERLARIAAGENEAPCQILDFDQFEIEKIDWYWWLRRSTEQKKMEAYNKYKQAGDGTQKHPSYWRWAVAKMEELNFCQEEI